MWKMNQVIHKNDLQISRDEYVFEEARNFGLPAFVSNLRRFVQTFIFSMIINHGRIEIGERSR